MTAASRPDPAYPLFREQKTDNTASRATDGLLLFNALMIRQIAGMQRFFGASQPRKRAHPRLIQQGTMKFPSCAGRNFFFGAEFFRR